MRNAFLFKYEEEMKNPDDLGSMFNFVSLFSNLFHAQIKKYAYIELVKILKSYLWALGTAFSCI